MHDDVDAAEALTNRVRHDRATFGGCNIRRDEQIRVGEFGRCCSGGGENPHARLAQPRDHGFADPLCAARDERPAAIQFETVGHERISSDAILLPANLIDRPRHGLRQRAVVVEDCSARAADRGGERLSPVRSPPRRRLLGAQARTPPLAARTSSASVSSVPSGDGADSGGVQSTGQPAAISDRATAT